MKKMTLSELLRAFKENPLKFKALVFSINTKERLKTIFAKELEEHRKDHREYYSNQNCLFNRKQIEQFFNPFKPVEIFIADNQAEDCCAFTNFEDYTDYLKTCLKGKK